MTISTIRNRIDEINNRINERTNELIEEQNPYIEMDSEIIALNSELTSLNNEMDIARNEVYAYAVNYRKNNLENDLKSTNNRYAERGKELTENDVDFTSQFMDEEYNSISNEINSIQGEINNLNGYIESYSQTRFGSLEKQLEEANANLEARINTLEEEGNNYPQMDEEVINLNGQISMLNDSIKKMKEEIKENAYYLRAQELENNLLNANKKIEEKEIELDNNNVSYDDRYRDEEYINLCREKDYIQKMIDNLKYKYDNNLLTEEIFNEISLPELPKKVNDKSSTKSGNDSSFDDSAKQKDSSQTDANDESKSNENGNTQTDTKDNSNDVENQIKDLEGKLKACAERMQKAREEGNEQAYAEEKSRYNYLTQEINKLKSNQQQRPTAGSGNDFGNSSNSDENNSDNSDDNESNNENDEENDKDMDEEELNLDENDKDEEKDNEKTEEEKKEERKQKIKKAAIGALGGAIGFGLSFALQPGTAGTVISVGRLVYSTAKKGLKVYTEKHKDDENNKIIKMVGKVKEFTKEQAEKHPKITSAISKVNNFLKKPETQVFLNGMAAGYTIGKISQAVYKMHEASAMEKNKQIEKSDIGDKNLDDKNIGDTTENKIETNYERPEPPVDPEIKIDTKPTFDPTKPVDLSSLGEGYVSSYSSDPVSLITSAGKNAMFDKINVVDGKTWVHFTQGNGAGYAWFPADEVLNALDLSDISELTGEVSGGMHL